jgi:hypothetical protein
MKKRRGGMKYKGMKKQREGMKKAEGGNEKVQERNEISSKGMKNAKGGMKYPTPQGTMKCLGISYHISLGWIEKTVQATAYTLS